MTDSILDSIKVAVGVVPTDTSFDQEIMMHINSVFSDLTQLGVGPSDGFMIEDNTKTWTNFLGESLLLNNAKSYMTLRVRLMFDGPESRYTIQAIKEQIAQYEWRMNVTSEASNWVDPLPNQTDQFEGAL